ncbi:MAG: hypothetical protein WC364_14420 [Eubacteriales bacterium]
MAEAMDDPNVEVNGKMADVGGDEPADTQSQQANEQVQTEQVQQTATVQTETPKANAQQVQAEQPKTSFLAEIESDDEQVVPDEEQQARTQQKRPGLIPDLQKERQKRHAAEQEAAQLRQQLQQQAQQQQAQQIDLDAEIKALLGDGDDSFVETKALAGVLGKVATTVAEKTRQSVLSEVNQQRQAERQSEQSAQQKEQRKQQMLASEAQARKTVKDYDAVVDAALKTGSLPKAELRMVLDAPNPALALYRKSKEVIAAFGIQPQQTAASRNTSPQGSETQQEQQPAADGEIQNDEDFMKSCGFTSRGR